MSTSVVNVRTVKNPIVHVDYEFIGRPSKWGNPFKIGRDGTRSEVIDKYRAYILTRPDLLAVLPELAGMRLGCYCYPLACHGDVLAEMADDAARRLDSQRDGQFDRQLAEPSLDDRLAVAFAARGDRTLGQFIERAFGVCGIGARMSGQCLSVLSDEEVVEALEAEAL